MRWTKRLFMWGTLVVCAPAFSQVGQNWSVERNVLPSGFGASEARVVILSDGSINVTFRGGPTDDPQVGGIYYTRSADQGYSWIKPRPAVSISGILPITHELLSDGDSLLLFAAMNRLARFEVQQYLSVNKGLTWIESETLFSSPDPLRGVMAWKLEGRMYVMVATERTRPGGESEFSFFLVRGRASGAYWEEPVKILNFFASNISSPRMVPSDRWPSIFWKQDLLDYHILETSTEDGANWRRRPAATAPAIAGAVLYDRGVYYRVFTTTSRQLLFNRTDDEAPTTPVMSTVPREIDKPNLKLTWQSKDNYTLPSALRYELVLDEGAPILIKDATHYEISGLLNGSHSLSLVSVDEAGNRQAPPTSRRFTVKVLPTAKFLAPRNGDLLNRGDLTASWEGTQNMPPDSPLQFSLRVDEGEWPEFIAESSAYVQGLADGDHVLSLKSKDGLENLTGSEATVRFEVDSTPPSCVAEETPRTWDDLAKELDFDQDPKFEVSFKVTGNDNRTSGPDLEYRYTLDQNAPSEWRPISEMTVLSGLPDGLHQIGFETRDEAQNIQAQPTSLKFTFNTPPNTRVWADDTAQVLTYRFAGKDSNSRPKDITFRWKIDEGSWSDWTDSAQLPSTDLIANAEHGEHVLSVQSQDSGGNLDTTPAELVIVVDKQAPPPPERITLVSQDDGGEIQMSWDQTPEANVVYRVYRSESETFDKNAAFAVELDTPKNRALDHPKRVESTVSVYYFVTAVDKSGNESNPTASEATSILGEEEINEKKFNEFKTTIESHLKNNQFEQVLEQARTIPEELIQNSKRRPYASYWELVAKSRRQLTASTKDVVALSAVRTEIENFIQRNPNFQQIGDIQHVFQAVKSALLWARMKTFGLYGLIFLILIAVLAFVYRYVQNKRIPEMPKIYAETATEGVTPSKEALKDPTVLRRWAEVQQDASSAENWSRLAFAFHNIGEVENAVQSLYKALAIEPNNTRFHFQMGHFQKEAGKMKEAVRHFERYLQLNPESKKSAEEVKELLAKLKQEGGG